MSPVRPGGEAEGPPPLHIHAWIRTREPVAGEVGVEDGPPIPFQGWLDLLARLSQVVGSAFPSGSGDRPRSSPPRPGREEVAGDR